MVGVTQNNELNMSYINEILAVFYYSICLQGPISFKRINVYPSILSSHILCKIQQFHGFPIEVSEWINKVLPNFKLINIQITNVTMLFIWGHIMLRGHHLILNKDDIANYFNT